MWFLVILLSTTTSLVRVDGRPQVPDLSKLPPGEMSVITSPELATSGAEGAPPSTIPTIDPPPAPTDSETTEPHGESAVPAEKPLAEGDPSPAISEEGPSPAASPSSGELGDVPETPDAGEASAASDDAPGGAKASEDLPGGGQSGEEGEREAGAAAEEGSTAASFVTSPPPEPAAAETEAPEPEVVETEAPEPEGVETEAPEPEVVETEAPEPEVVETEAPEPEVVETEAPEPEAVETEAPEPEVIETEAQELAEVETEEPLPVAVETEAPEPVAVETEAPELAITTEPTPATAEPVATTEAASAVAGPVTEAAATAEDPATEAAATTPERTEKEEARVTETSRPAEAVTEAAVTRSEVTASTPEPQQDPVEQGKAAAGLLDAAAEVLPAGAVSPGAQLGEQRTGKLEVTEPPADTRAAAAGGEGAPGGAAVELEDVYNQGLKSQFVRSSVLTSTIDDTLRKVLQEPREVAYRLGRHTVTTVVTDLRVTGVRDMHVLEVRSSMDEMSLNATFQFPNITFTGRFNATGSIMGRRQRGVLLLRTPFPSYGHGNITAVITNTTAVSQAELSHSFNDRKLSVELLTCQLTFGEPQVWLSDVQLPRALHKLQFQRLFRVALGKMISHQLATEIEPKVDESLHDVITGVLNQVSLDTKGADNFTSLGTNPGAWQII